MTARRLGWRFVPAYGLHCAPTHAAEATPPPGTSPAAVMQQLFQLHVKCCGRSNIRVSNGFALTSIMREEAMSVLD
jgi:hypothetical protein